MHINKISYARIICGNFSTTPSIHTSIYQNLTKVIQFYFSKIIYFCTSPSNDDKTYLAPFCSRALLEACLTALLGRIDPFRLLIVGHMQSNTRYEHGKRNLSGIQWSSDIMVDDKCITDKSTNNLWDQSNSIVKISRSLFSPHVDRILWEPAFANFIDSLDNFPNIEIIKQLETLEADRFIPTIKGKALRLYPSLSKGVHSEFLLPLQTLLDDATINEYINDCLDITLSLGIVSHFIEHAHHRISVHDLSQILAPPSETIDE